MSSAVAAGVCGAPSFEVRFTPEGGEEEPPLLFWGKDRLDQVAAALRGWRPAAG